jgi:hypothetical protein
MIPRNPSQKKWTALPSEFREKAAQVFAQNFARESKQGSFLIDGRIYPEEIVMRAGYVENGRLKQTNFEVSLDLAGAGVAAADKADSAKASVMDKLFLGIDVLGSVFETHFEHLQEEEEGEIEYPMTWEEYDFDDAKVFLRFSTVNTALEEAADRLLGESAPALYQDESEVENPDALALATIDTDLAQDVSRAIREGRYKPQGHEAIEPDIH